MTDMVAWNNEWCCKCSKGGDTGCDCDIWDAMCLGVTGIEELGIKDGKTVCTQFEDKKLHDFLEAGLRA